MFLLYPICWDVLWKTYNHFIPGLDPVWSQCVILLTCCWILFANFVENFGIYINERYLAVVFFSHSILTGFGIGVIVVSSNDFGSILSSSIFGRNWEELVFGRLHQWNPLVLDFSLLGDFHYWFALLIHYCSAHIFFLSFFLFQTW